MIRRMLKIAALALGAAALIGTGVGARRALAHGPGAWQHGMFKNKLNAHIDGALDAAKATDAQRNAIHAARDHVFATFEEGRKGHGKDFARALALFEADRVDPSQIAAIRAEKEADAKRMGDAMVQAVTDAHDALTGPQRKIVGDYLRAQRPSHMGGHGNFMKRMVNQRIDQALDVAKASRVQRAAVHAAADRAIAGVADGRPDPSTAFEQAISIFEADTLDQAKIAALRAEHHERMRKTGDSVLSAIQDAHAALSPQQRKAITEWVRTQRPAGME